MHICVHASNTKLVLADQRGDIHDRNQKFHPPLHIRAVLGMWVGGFA